MIDDAKQFAYDIYSERDIIIDYMPDVIYQPQDWTPINLNGYTISMLFSDFFEVVPPSTGFNEDEIHMVIFDDDYLSSYMNNLMPPFSNQTNPATRPRVNVYWDKIPSRNVAVAWPTQKTFNYYFGPFNEQKIINAGVSGGIGCALGLIPLELSDVIGDYTNGFVPIETSGRTDCHKSGDFLCDTKPPIGENSFNSVTCDFTPPGFEKFPTPSGNVMSYHQNAYGCIDHITEEQARKIRYVFSNDFEMYGCLNGNSTLEFEDFEITSMYTIIDQNTTWTKPAAVHILKIEEGVTFTTNSRIDFAPGNLDETNEPFHDPHIVRKPADYSNGYTQEIIFDNGDYMAQATVEATGRFNIFGGELNSYYSYHPWMGVTVAGNRYQPQTSAYQGIVHFQDATVRMAHEVIYPNARECLPNSNYCRGPRISSTTGSYVFAFDTDFINCRRVIGFRAYANMRNVGGTPRELNNVSHFTRCNILHNDGYRFPSVPIGITLHMVNGVKITGCKFENSMSDVVAQHLSTRGDAVFAQQANFYIDENCQGLGCFSRTPSTISGYHRGVFAQSAHPSGKPTVVKNTEFNYNSYSAYFENTNYFEFEDNVLNMPPGLQNQFNFHSPNPYGLYVKSSINFTVEGNFFTEAQTIPSYLPLPYPSDPAGMVVNSTYTEADAAYRNTFEGLRLGLLALGQNRTDNFNGFQIRCNIFNEGDYDISVPPPGEGNENSVGTYQGYAQSSWEPKDLAGNLFSHFLNTPGVPNDFNNVGSPFWVFYNYHDDPSEPRLAPRPDHIYRVFPYPLDCDFFPEESCPPGEYNPNMDIVVIAEPLTSGQLHDLKNDYFSDYELLHQLIDQGNTPQLLADIFSYPESEYYDLFLDLMSQSPYLSEEALIEIINTPGFPDVLLRNLLMENPQSITNEGVEAAIIERIPALPQYMIDDIFNATDLFGPKEALESRIAYKRANFMRHANAMYKVLVNEMAEDDETAWLTDSLLSLLDVINSPQSLLMKAQFMQYYGMSGYASAYQSAKNLVSSSDTSLMYQEIEGLAELMELSLDVQDSLTTSQIQILEYWRNTDYPAVQSLAYGMLRQNGVATDSLLYDPVIMPAPIPKSRIQRKIHDTKVNPNRMKLYPNPAKDYTVLHYELSGVDRKINYRMIDLNGKSLMQNSIDAKVKGDEIIALPNVANGTYILIVEEENGTLIESIKINIVK
ncbi:MAG: T9SS type A sorting domain-containing protein [Cryomorphaceae bacterium]|nr:T9SS type A sorting domain-containing protein [Cryomorphaceae bacterium]